MIDIEQEDSYTHKRPEIVYWEELMENYHIPYDQLEATHYIATKHLAPLVAGWYWWKLLSGCKWHQSSKQVEMDDPELPFQSYIS